MTAATGGAVPVRALALAWDVLRSAARRVDRRGLGAVLLAALGFVVLATFGFTAMWAAPLETLLSRLVHTAIASLVVFAAVLVADEAVSRGLRPLPTYALAVGLGAIVGSQLGFEVRGALGLNYAMHRHGYATLPTLFTWVRRIDLVLILWIVGGLGTVAHVSRRNALAARRRQQDAEAARARAQRRTLESELQALQARVEPAFLFETLDRIRRLYRVDRAAAGRMLEDLIVYLRAALPHLRESTSTVAQEAELVRAWLDIMRASMGALDVSVRLDEAAVDARLPALVLLPLVQHALAGAETGHAALTLQAATDQGRLQLRVDTSTRAFGAPGAALEPLRERLHALHAERASLTTGPSATGSRATLELPLETA